MTDHWQTRRARVPVLRSAAGAWPSPIGVQSPQDGREQTDAEHTHAGSKNSVATWRPREKLSGPRSDPDLDDLRAAAGAVFPIGSCVSVLASKGGFLS